METLESLENADLEPSGRAKGPEPEDEYRSSPLRKVGIILFAIFAFFFFLILKLPEARIQNLVIAHIRIMAQEQGFLFSAEKIRVGMLLGPSLKMYNVELKSIDDEHQTLKIPYLKIRPKLLSLLGSTKKVGISAELLGGGISGTVGLGTASMVVDLSFDDVDIGAATLMKRFLTVDASAKINGSVYLDIDQEKLQKSDGKINLAISKLALPPQALYGFKIPKVNVNESKIEITVAQGQLLIRNFEVGKDLKTDDIVAHITGDGVLERNIDRSRINAKAVFELSSRLVESFPLLDALLGPAKTNDGKYAYRISGPLSSLEAQPGG